MVSGFFIGNTPFVQIIVGGVKVARKAFFVLDTGFSGDLQVTPEIVDTLGLHFHNTTRAFIADGSCVEVPVAVGVAFMDESIVDIEMLVSRGAPLAGIGFLSKFGCTAVVDCKDRKVSLRDHYH